jgi:hypothetical protein
MGSFRLNPMTLLLHWADCSHPAIRILCKKHVSPKLSVIHAWIRHVSSDKLISVTHEGIYRHFTWHRQRKAAFTEIVGHVNTRESTLSEKWKISLKRLATISQCPHVQCLFQHLKRKSGGLISSQNCHTQSNFNVHYGSYKTRSTFSKTYLES